MVESQFAERTRLPKRMWVSMPCLRAVAVMYSRMSSPSATPSSRVHGSHGKLSVKMLLSLRTPGYRNRSQVPPIWSRRSRMT